MLAEAPETVRLEGNHYFPADSVRCTLLAPTGTRTRCPWKGEATQ